MAMNRRNVLIGLGAVAAGGGAALGTGAFSQVEAERTVNVTTSDDASALLAFSVDTSYNGISDDSVTDDGTNNQDIVQINLVDINDNATTTFDAALTVTNNGSQEVTLTASDVPTGLTFSGPNNDLSGTGETIASGNSVDIDISVDTTESVSGGTVMFDAQ